MGCIIIRYTCLEYFKGIYNIRVKALNFKGCTSGFKKCSNVVPTKRGSHARWSVIKASAVLRSFQE